MLVGMSSVSVSLGSNMDFYLKQGGGYELPVFEPGSITCKANVLFTVPSLYPCDMILEPPERIHFFGWSQLLGLQQYGDTYRVSVNCNIYVWTFRKSELVFEENSLGFHWGSLVSGALGKAGPLGEHIQNCASKLIQCNPSR